MVVKVQQKVDLIKEKNGKPKSLSQTRVEIPSKGINEIIMNNGDTVNVNNVRSKGTENGVSSLDINFDLITC